MRSETLFTAAKKVTILILTGLMLSACAGPKVKVGNLDAAKGKVYRIGIVKAAGSTPVTILPFTDSKIDAKKRALEQINIEEICAKLRKVYGLQIDPVVDRTVRTVREGVGGAQPQPPRTGTGVSVNLKFSAESAYFGNLRYDDASKLWIMLGGSPTLNNGAQLEDVVDLVYDFELRKMGLETAYLYTLKVSSSGENVLEVSGEAATIPTPMYGPFADNDAIWDQYVKNAAHIPEALEHDLGAAQKKE